MPPFGHKPARTPAGTMTGTIDPDIIGFRVEMLLIWHNFTARHPDRMQAEFIFRYFFLYAVENRKTGVKPRFQRVFHSKK
jgi:hypothetical protein